MLDQNLHKNHSFSTFVPLQMTKQNTMIIDIEVEVLHETTLITKNIHKIDTVLHLEIETDSVYDKSTTPPHYSRSRYDTCKRDSRSYRSPYRSSYRSPYRQNSRSRYRSRSYSRDDKFNKYTIHIDHLLDQETLDFPDPDHNSNSRNK